MAYSPMIDLKSQESIYTIDETSPASINIPNYYKPSILEKDTTFVSSMMGDSLTDNNPESIRQNSLDSQNIILGDNTNKTGNYNNLNLV